MSTSPGDATPSVPPENLDLQLIALRERLNRELPRNTPGASPSTEAVGGWSKLGARLDGTLRALFATLCDERGEDPVTTWQRATRTPYDRVTGGAVAHVLTHDLADVTSTQPIARALLADLRASGSVVRAVIGWRNDFVHERNTPQGAEVVTALLRLRDLLDALDRLR